MGKKTVTITDIESFGLNAANFITKIYGPLGQASVHGTVPY